MRNKQHWLIFLLVTGSLIGCSSSSKKDSVEDLDYHLAASPSVDYETYYHTKNPKGIIGASYTAADSLIERAKNIRLHRDRPILATSFVNIDNVKASSTFGRMLGEQMGSRFAQHGYNVVEMKMRSSIFVQEQTGELMLSRQLREISLQHNAYAVLVGTYAQGKRRVYVTAKLVRAENNIILASYDYELPIGPDTKYLLRVKTR